ncbi:DUF5686 and carboxypeptidase-like regulatory domain-containing protein [Mucilaginibacter sp.]|uniref:DUF5686 and carboxypeptidase-like regulatory domain-containing protein n=1 Tax=Mucilaginibacter sp. TaxID=1882438 RepID=UPI002622EB93|nr:DUF5686 and carboxypeptidase-like regulatory domain-containing protein [Mucilaginibacter sp.]
MKKICVFVLVIAPLWCTAQQKDTLIKKEDSLKKVTGVSGQIIDAVSGKSLPFITIGFTGSSYGTMSDGQGKFDLSAPGSFSSITFSYMGYQTITKTIRPGQLNELHIRLQSSQTQLKEVMITSGKSKRYRNKGNPAVDLIQQVINHKDQNRMESADYLQYDQYERLALSLFHLSPKFLNGHFFSKYKFMLDTAQVINGEAQTSLPVYFSEKRYQYYYKKNPPKSIQVLNAQKELNIITFIDTVGLDTYLNRLYGNNIDIYANNIFIITNQFLSPIADHAPDFYKFFITDTVQSGKEKLVEISFTPRNKGDLLFEGKIMVTLDGHYAVESCELNVNKQININFMRSLKVRQDFGKYPDGHYYLTKSDVITDFGILKDKGLGLFGERTVFYEHYKLNTPLPAPFYEGKSSQTALNSSQTDTGYWQKHRPDTLTSRQAKVYANFNRLESMPSFKRTSWIASTITGGYADLGAIQAGPFDASYSFNSVEGSRFRLGGRTTPLFNKSIYLEGYSAYGTKDHIFKYYLGSTFSFNQKPYYQFPNDYLKVSYQYDTDIPGQNFLIEKSQSILLSIRRGTSDFWLYNKIFRIDYIKDFENHFSYNVEFKNWNQQPAGALNYQINNQANSPVQNLTTTELDLGLRYAPNEHIMQGTMYRHTIYSKYPIFNTQINHGFSGILNGSYSYTNVSASIFKRFYLSQLGYTDITLQGGILLGQVPFPLLNIIPANQTYLYDPNAYNMMYFLEFVSDHYAGLNLTHSFGGFFLNKVPLIDHLKWREYLSLKILYGGLRNENNPRYTTNLYQFPISSSGSPATYSLGNIPYIEAGVGIGNIFKLIRIDVIRRFNYLDHPGITPYGLRFSFSPDF